MSKGMRTEVPAARMGIESPGDVGITTRGIADKAYYFGIVIMILPIIGVIRLLRRGRQVYPKPMLPAEKSGGSRIRDLYVEIVQKEKQQMMNRQSASPPPQLRVLISIVRDLRYGANILDPTQPP